MKQLKLFLALLIIGTMAVSCKKEKENNNTDALLVTKIITTDAEGKKNTALYEYNGTKIRAITETSNEGTTVYTYTYTGDDISKIVESNGGRMVKSQSFVHGGGKLLMWAENYETDSETCFSCETTVTVDYNADGSQTVKYYVAGSKEVQKQIEVTKTANSYNNSDNIYERASDGSVKLFAISRTIDNPHKNITGWTKLERLNLLMYSAYNPIGYAETDGSTEDGYLITYGVPFGFPTEETAKGGRVSDSRTFLYKKEYFYNKSL